MTAKQHFLEAMVGPYRTKDGCDWIVFLRGNPPVYGKKLQARLISISNRVWNADRWNSLELRQWWNALSCHERLRLERIPAWLMEEPAQQSCERMFPHVQPIRFLIKHTVLAGKYSFRASKGHP